MEKPWGVSVVLRLARRHHDGAGEVDVLSLHVGADHLDRGLAMMVGGGGTDEHP
jgi:hypothetical protein